jgi:hypothetical protein
MKIKLGALALGLLATTAIAIGALGAATTASANEPQLESADAAIASGDHTRLPYWLKNSIIACAAKTMDERVAVVKAALRQGYSLKEIGIRHGVRPEALEDGILRCERHFSIVSSKPASSRASGAPHLRLHRGPPHAHHQLHYSPDDSRSETTPRRNPDCGLASLPRRRVCRRRRSRLTGAFCRKAIRLQSALNRCSPKCTLRTGFDPQKSTARAKTGAPVCRAPHRA